jgi:hypothetical protein
MTENNSTKFYHVSISKTLLAMQNGSCVTFRLTQAHSVRTIVTRLKSQGHGDWMVTVKGRTNTLVQRIK